ncbi:solute carrier organic anion transporter family, member 1D1 isoform X1 [Lepisosteus oculatus]|uniref:solute carrier organic anion transporter family, member 1D1 isoform X1 n=2 Tax=Lepisosteus oculatus TaxID=7918 RepID=UPI003720A6DE
MGVNAKKLPESQMEREPCCSKLKMFLVSLSFVYFAKAFQGSYMKSSITQIERRFDIPSSLIGVIDGSFEMGNLLVIAFVSYFGAKLHRPRLIGAGCLLMALGSFCTALPHFFMGHYQYETSIEHSSNLTVNTSPCLANQSNTIKDTSSPDGPKAECEQEVGSSMWIYVFLGNMLRGIGETPIMPLGLSYLDDFSQEENTAFYIACVQTVGIMGPMFGFLLGSLCAKMYVDIGSVDLDSLTIHPKDSRWVGAWWLGFLVTGVAALLAGIPFWFLPRSLPKQGKTESSNGPSPEQATFIQEIKREPSAEKPQAVTISEMAKDFLPSLKRLFCNSVFVLLLCVSIVQVNSFMGMITFKPKYMEQIYGQSASKAIFLIGILNLPAVALGIITGGFILKRFKLSVIGAARITIGASFTSFLILLIYYGLSCENTQVAGLTVSYEGVKQVSYQENSLLSQCNLGCTCSLKIWDPVCADHGVTFASPCLAGCKTSTGAGKQLVFHNCSCLEAGPLQSENTSAILGQCPRPNDCESMFKYYMIFSVIGAYISACGATPGYIILLRSIKPELKSLALGIQTLFVRTLGGIPAPIYFGALIDRTCLKWGSKRCGGRGACRLYDSDAFRVVYLGLIYGLYSLSYILWGTLYAKLSRRHRQDTVKKNGKNDGNANGQGDNMHNQKVSPIGTSNKEEVVERETSM